VTECRTGCHPQTDQHGHYPGSILSPVTVRAQCVRLFNGKCNRRTTVPAYAELLMRRRRGLENKTKAI
jgi:hypothetical protein